RPAAAAGRHRCAVLRAARHPDVRVRAASASGRLQLPGGGARRQRARPRLRARLRDRGDLPGLAALLMRLLVLGGTKFLGRATVDAALANGHELTLFNRGQTNPDLYPDVETIHGDRTEDLGALDRREWDAVLDMATFLPRVVRLSVDALRGRVQRYVYVSSISAYADFTVAPVEGAVVAELEDPTSESIDDYGALKAACEHVVVDAYGDAAWIVRPGLIVGPHDPTDRFTYGPRRVAAGGRVLAPAPPDAPVQFIDVRDLGAWIVHATERGASSVFNATGEPITFKA